ncbi:hypothetical protein F5Y09DRAFT_314650 [Xylaria sp. FL1042]|nr:hypothetical protein F5Y09DRAFT_314650 [Xylaria sp. FL1042]
MRGNLVEAQEVLERVLDFREALCGKWHLHTLMTLNNVGRLYYEQDKMSVVEAALSRAIVG